MKSQQIDTVVIYLMIGGVALNILYIFNTSDFRCFVLYKLEGNSQCEFLFLKSLKSQRTLLTVSKCLNRKIQKLSMAFEQNPTQRVP